MKNEMSNQELVPDPALGAALRWAEGEVPIDEVDWPAMRSTIRSRAALPLARRRVRSGRAIWLRPLIPIAAAASIAVFLWTGVGSEGPSASPVSSSGAGSEYQISVQEALLADMSEQEFQLLVADRNDPDALLMVAASER